MRKFAITLKVVRATKTIKVDASYWEDYGDSYVFYKYGERVYRGSWIFKDSYIPHIKVAEFNKADVLYINEIPNKNNNDKEANKSI